MWDLRSPDCVGLMQCPGRPVVAFDPEGLIFAVGLQSEQIKLYDLRGFDKVRYFHSVHVFQQFHSFPMPGSPRPRFRAKLHLWMIVINLTAFCYICFSAIFFLVLIFPFFPFLLPPFLIFSNVG
jgi:hypothetical protein